MKNPYRVIVWAPGGVGRACLKELIRLPEFDVVGVLAYSKEKEGIDVGTFVGKGPIGVEITTDIEAMIAMEADCVVWCGTFPFPHIVDDMDDCVIRLLESGKNVVSPTAYHYPPSHGPEYVKKFQDACQKGNSCLHGTGENPGFWLERVALTLTGLCNDVEYIKLDEYADCATSGTSVEVLNGIGLGVPIDVAKQTMEAGPLAAVWKNYYFVEMLNLVSVSLYGKPLDRFEHTPTYHRAEREIVLSKGNGASVDMVIDEGSVCAQTHHFQGYVDGSMKLSVSTNWFLLPENSPFNREDSVWDIEIEGRPTSLKCTINAMASVKNNLEFREGDDTSPTWYATAMPAIQAIPVLNSHEPGIVYASIFASCAPDLRLLETRKAIV